MHLNLTYLVGLLSGAAKEKERKEKKKKKKKKKRKMNIATMLPSSYTSHVWVHFPFEGLFETGPIFRPNSNLS